MTDITIRSDFEVELADSAGSDTGICRAARVSNMGNNAWKTEESQGLINFLLANRHGSPFEHGFMTFRIKAPIFVWREFMRHRIGFSYNEQSGRYMEMSPEFYKPPLDRPLRQIGKPGHYTFVPGTDEQKIAVDYAIGRVCTDAWWCYQYMLELEVAKEVARMVLPVTTYSSAYVSCNPRSMMSFLSLRTKHEDSKFPSYPQWEINQVADKMEAHFRKLYPLTHHAFNNAGRVSP